MFFGLDMFSIIVTIIHLLRIIDRSVILTMWSIINTICMDRDEIASPWIDNVQ